MSELDEFVERGRKLRERQERAPRRSWNWSRLWPKRSLETEALAGDLSLWLLAMSTAALGIGYGAWWALGRITPEPGPLLLASLWVVIAIVGVVFAYLRMQRRAADRARAWLAALPFAGDWSKYMRTLGKERVRAFVRVRVSLQRSLPDTDGRRIADAAQGMVGKGKATCNDDLLEISSPELKTWFQGNADRESRHSSVRVHAWVRRALGAVLRIHREQPVVRVDIDVRE